MTQIKDKNIVVLGASRGVGREIALRARAEGGRVLAVARGEDELRRLAGEAPGIDILALDAASEEAPRRVFEQRLPTFSWSAAAPGRLSRAFRTCHGDEFTTNWECDVKMSFLFCAEALRTPLKAGSAAILIQAAPRSAARRFREATPAPSARRCSWPATRRRNPTGSDLGFALLRWRLSRIMPETALGKAAVEGYARYLGIPSSDFVEGMTDRQSPGDVADAVMSIAANPAIAKDASYSISSKGLSPTAPR